MSLHLVSIKAIRDIIKDAFAAGMLEADKIRYPNRDLISQREAYRRFGETSIKRWRNAGLITPQRTGPNANHTLTYSVAEIAEAKMAESIQRALLPPPENKKAQSKQGCERQQRLSWLKHQRVRCSRIDQIQKEDRLLRDLRRFDSAPDHDSYSH